MDDLDIYLNTLFDGLEGLVYSPIKTSSDWKTAWFEYPSQKDALKKHILSDAGDIYISPAVYSEKRAKKEFIKKVQCVWVDFDGLEKIDFKNVGRPTLLVQTSFESKVHCYWKIGPTNQTSVEELNRRLTYHLGADNGGWDIVQLLRPPGTINYKRNLPVLLASQGPDYTFGHFETVPQVSAPILAPVTLEELIEVKDILSSHQLPIKLVKMITKESPGEPYRSSFHARLANELAEESLTHREIVSCLLLADSRIKKYVGRSDQLVRLSQIADYALHKVETENDVIIYTPIQILKYVESLQWILPNYLHTNGQMMISSAPGVGKTQLMFQLAYCLESGERFLGMKAPDRHRPLFFSLEMNVRPLKYIMEHHQHEWNVDPSFQVIDEPLNLIGYENLIEKQEPTVLIVDSLTELFDDTADNANAEARRVMLWCRKIRRRYGLAVILIHHNRKATEGNKKPKGLADLAGSFQFGKDSDTVVQVWEDHKGIEWSSSPKARYGPKETFMITRNEHLWFARENASNESRTVRTDSKRDERLASFSFRHGDSDNRPALRALPFRSSNNDLQ